MNPNSVRSAIITGLNARAAWNDLEDGDFFRYPAGDRAGRRGFELGAVEAGESEDVTLAGTPHEVTYNLLGSIWVPMVGAKDDDFATAEAAAMALLKDFQAWLVAVDHGKSISIATLDYLELTDWKLGFTVEDPAAVIGFTLEVTEYL